VPETVCDHCAVVRSRAGDCCARAVAGPKLRPGSAPKHLHWSQCSQCLQCAQWEPGTHLGAAPPRCQLFLCLARPSGAQGWAFTTAPSHAVGRQLARRQLARRSQTAAPAARAARGSAHLRQQSGKMCATISAQPATTMALCHEIAPPLHYVALLCILLRAGAKWRRRGAQAEEERRDCCAFSGDCCPQRAARVSGNCSSSLNLSLKLDSELCIWSCI